MDAPDEIHNLMDKGFGLIFGVWCIYATPLCDSSLVPLQLMTTGHSSQCLKFFDCDIVF